MSRSLRIAVVALAVSTAGSDEPRAQASTPYESVAAGEPQTQIDRLVFARIQAAGQKPARLCSDAVFLRRVFLDVLGTLPTAKEARDFLLEDRPDKRARLIDAVLQRPEWADYQAMHWGDLLRIKSEFPINLWPNAAQAYHRFVRDAFRRNLAYTQFVRELLTKSGSNFRVPQVNFYRAVQKKDATTIARAVALTFMGVRAERWPQPRLAGMAGFFARTGFKSTAEWKEEIVFFDRELPPRAAVFPDGKAAQISANQDPRRVFADWLVRPDNPWFARCFVNRTWARLLGRGLVHEVDDFRPDNPPSHPRLLQHLATTFVAGGCDVKRLYRSILSSKTYQLSCVPPPGQERPKPQLFAVHPLRRLEAEVLIDAINQITGGTERYSSAIPEPFTFLPPTQRSIAIPDGSITSAFLEKFGRPPRDTGLVAERVDRSSAAQRLHLINSGHIQQKLERGGRLRFLSSAQRKPRQTISLLYLTILSRYPTRAERETARRYLMKQPARTAGVDLAWALINTAEFLHRH